MIGRRVRVGQSQKCCWCWVKRAERGVSTLRVSSVSQADVGSAANLLLVAWLGESLSLLPCRSV